MNELKGLAALIKAELTEQLFDTAYSAWSMALPLGVALMCGLVTGPAAGLAALSGWGLIVAVAMVVTGCTNVPLAWQQRVDSGLYRRIEVTPLRPVTLIAACALANVVLSLPAAFAACGIAWLFGIRPEVNLAAVAIWLIVLRVLTLGLGLGLARGVKDFLKLKLLGNLACLYLLGGFAAPSQQAPFFVERSRCRWRKRCSVRW